MNASSPASSELVEYIRHLRSLDTIDACRLRLVALRARIGSHWPETGGLLRRSVPLPPETEAAISDLLAALPTPLPLGQYDEPEELFPRGEKDLRAVVGRAVDAALALLEAGSLDLLYPGEVWILAKRPGRQSAERIFMAQPTIGLLVATIVGTLEAVSECLGAEPRPTPPHSVFRAD